eukprot:365698_1
MPSQGECNTKRDCNRCGGESDQNLLKCCFACHVTSLYGRLWYCSTKCQREDRKARQDTKCYILCSKVHYLPKAVEEVKDRIESFSLDQYTTENIGTFWVTEAEAGRGQIVEEREAQDMCYDAWDMPKGSVEKWKKILVSMVGHISYIETFPAFRGRMGESWTFLSLGNEIAQDQNEGMCYAAEASSQNV